MTRTLSKALAIVCLLGTSLGAQRPVSLALGGGASVRTSGFGEHVSTGWHALAALAVSSPMQPLGLRLDAAWNQFDSDTPISAGRRTALSGTFNVTYRVPTPGTPVSPYAIAGLGAYRFGCAGDVPCAVTTKFGWNAGLGMKFVGLGLRPFLEARYHDGLGSGGGRYLSATLGLMF